MKIAIPSETDAGLESIRSGHFGHAAYMTVVEFDDDMNIVGVESVKNADHDAVGCGGVIDFVSGIGVDGILTVGMGMPPFTRFTNAGIKVRYMHHDIDTIERMEIIRDLRLGTFDVLVGINLLREGLDLPEVSLVAILDADKEGFLRSETSLIQTIGRAARNADGMVVMYADTITPSMRRAIDETERRREKQDAFNKAHGIVPRTVIKSVRELLEISATAEDVASNQRQGRVKAMTRQEKAAEIARLEKAMKEAAKMLEFELAATLRDQIIELRGK